MSRSQGEFRDERQAPRAYLRSRLPFLIGLVLLVFAIIWSIRHFMQVFLTAGVDVERFAVLWAVVFGWLLFHLVLAWTNRPWVATAEDQAKLDKLHVNVAIPVYNEDPEALVRALRSVFAQTRLPNSIHVVDDGSVADLANAKREIHRIGDQHPTVALRWTRTENRGKRHAQIEAFSVAPDADIFATMDSDTILDPDCIRTGLLPFAQREITSVASVILAYNNRHWLVRLTDSWLLAFQMVTRAAMSRLGAVLVNSGNFSMYRAVVVREALASYATETLWGRSVMFSDDSLLTLFAQLRGKTVQQESSVAFTVQPETVSHHLRQQIRWMRGSTIRSLWRFRYLPLSGWAYWEHFAAWINFVLVTFAFVAIVIVVPIVSGQFDPMVLVLMMLICYMTVMRYLVLARTDQSLAFQIGTVLLAPVMMTWTAVVLRPLRIYSIATCFRTEWGTRARVEVELAK